MIQEGENALNVLKKRGILDIARSGILANMADQEDLWERTFFNRNAKALVPCSDAAYLQFR